METPGPVQDLVEAANAGLSDEDRHGLLRVTEDPPSLALGYRPLHGSLVDMLLGFTAPAHWLMIGVHFRGNAKLLDSAFDEEDSTLWGVTCTLLLDGLGNGAGVMRSDNAVTPLPGAPEGMLGDALRRCFRLPTPPAPASTAELWLLCWLDRLAESVALLGCAGPYTTWPAVAALHPAVTSPAQDTETGSPSQLAEATQRLAAQWSWEQLRKDPELVDIGCPLPQEIAEWMDDGMIARWHLGRLPTIDTFATRLQDKLPQEVLAAIQETVTAAGVQWPKP